MGILLISFISTHRGRDEMSTVLHTTFSNAFSRKKPFQFETKFHQNMFLGVRPLGSDPPLVQMMAWFPTGEKSPIWTNNGLVYYMACDSLDDISHLIHNRLAVVACATCDLITIFPEVHQISYKIWIVSLKIICETLKWRHNGRDSVYNHQPHHCLLNGLFRRRSMKTSKLRVTGLCVGNSPETGEFPAQMASNAENLSIWWRHHEEPLGPISRSIFPS